MTSLTAQHLMDIRDSDWRRLYLLQHPLAITVAAVLEATGVLLLFSPPLFAHSVVAQSLPSGLEYPWDLTLILGGSLMLTGFWRLNVRIEAAGAIMLCSALLVWVLVYVSADAGVSIISVALALAVASGLASRALIVLTAPEPSPWSRRYP